MKKIKPILICGGLLLSTVLALSACNVPEQQSNHETKATTSKSIQPSKEKTKNSPFSSVPKSDQKQTRPVIPKENESAMKNFAKATLNRILNGSSETKKENGDNTSNILSKAVEAKEDTEEVTKPVHLTMADIDTKPVITVKQGKDEPKPIVINQPTIPKDEPSTGPIIIDVPVDPEPEPDVPKVDIPDKKPDISITVPETDKTEPSQPSETTEPNEPIETPIVKTTPILKIQTPVITINEGDEFILENYVELTDVPDAEAKMSTDEFSLEVGKHTITVTATNKFGNTATALLSVVVNAKPKLFLSQDTLEIEKGSTFNPMAFASATDTEDGDLSSEIQVDNPVNTEESGSYDVVYTVEDSNGATTTATLVVTVKESGNKDTEESENSTDPKPSDTNEIESDHEDNGSTNTTDSSEDEDVSEEPIETNVSEGTSTSEENVDIHTVVPEA